MPASVLSCAVENNGTLVASMLLVAMLAFGLGLAAFPLLRDWVLGDHSKLMEDQPGA